MWGAVLGTKTEGLECQVQVRALPLGHGEPWMVPCVCRDSQKGAVHSDAWRNIFRDVSSWGPWGGKGDDGT